MGCGPTVRPVPRKSATSRSSGFIGRERRAGIRLGKFVEQRPGVADRALDLPEGVAAVQFPVPGFWFPLEPGTGNWKLNSKPRFPPGVFSSSLRNSGTRLDEIVNGGERREAALTNDGAGGFLTQPAGIAKAEALAAGA